MRCDQVGLVAPAGGDVVPAVALAAMPTPMEITRKPWKPPSGSSSSAVGLAASVAWNRAVAGRRVRRVVVLQPFGYIRLEIVDAVDGRGDVGDRDRSGADGDDVRSKEVRSVVLISLIGSSATEALSQAGVQIWTNSAVSAIKQVPGRVLIQINKAIGFRLITKAGTKGVVNLTKLASVVGE